LFVVLNVLPLFVDVKSFSLIALKSKWMREASPYVILRGEPQLVLSMAKELMRYFTEFILSQKTRSFAPLRMTGEGLRVTVSEGFRMKKRVFWRPSGQHLCPFYKPESFCRGTHIFPSSIM
jgi:hypothetical protein